jgi:hypothetical protein
MGERRRTMALDAYLEERGCSKFSRSPVLLGGRMDMGHLSPPFWQIQDVFAFACGMGRLVRRFSP